MAKYIFDKQKLIDNIQKLKISFQKQDLDFEIHYSVKTNFANEVLETISQECEFEIVSADEWDKIKGFNPKIVVLNGPSKTQSLVVSILESGVEKLYFNTDNDTDLEILNNLEDKYHNRLVMGLRIYLNKSGIWNRFGFDIESERTKEIILKYQNRIKGFHFHFSTNNFNLNNYESILHNILRLIDKYSLNIEFIDIGGGLPGASEEMYSNQIYEKLPNLISVKTKNRFYIISEVGRNVIEDTFSLETNIVSIKKLALDRYDVVIDTNILHFPCYWEKKFGIEFINNESKEETEHHPVFVNIYGNSCMQVDKVAEDLLINTNPKVGDKILLTRVGAYSLSQASNFISKIPDIIFK